MSEKVAIKKTTLEAIGEAVRGKEGSTELIPVNSLADRITAIPSSSAESKLAQFAGGTLKVITAEDLKGITTIKAQAFYGETSLETLEIGNNIKTIGESAFRSCSNLTGVTIGSGIEIIGQGAFEGDIKITVVNIDDLAKWCKAFFSGAYSIPTCQGNANVFIKNSNGTYEPATDVVIPNTVTFLNQYTFAFWKGLESVIIPKGVTGIGPYVFYGCRDLISVTIPEGVESIGFYAFYGCSSITNLTIPSSVTQISAFDIGSETNKATVTFLRPTPISITSTFFNTARIEKIIVPKGCGEAYKTATNWANFADLIEESAE